MSGYWSEKYQLGILAHFLKEKGIRYTTEARLYSIPIDVLGLQRGQTIAIEMKSRDIGRGLKQAERNRSLVDYSFLSVWEEHATETLVERMEGSKIGLLSVGSDVKCLSPPAECDASEHAKKRAEERVLENVRK